MFGRVLLVAAVLNSLFAVRMETASALDGAGQVPLVAVEKARCRPGDKVETGLQGQVPLGDRVSGRAGEGYFCNMTMVGGVRTRSFANFDVYGDCAYYTESPGGFGGPGADGHGNVIDVSDPTRPVVTATLTARAMGNAGESCGSTPSGACWSPTTTATAPPTPASARFPGWPSMTSPPTAATRGCWPTWPCRTAGDTRAGSHRTG